MSPTATAAASLFFQVIELPPDQRGAFLDSACGTDAELRGAVASLLAAGLSHPTAPSPLILPPGTRIAGFTIMQKVGAGGIGVVYKAQQDQPRRIVALKLVQPGLLAPDAIRRFKQESDALARLHHPCIAQVYQAGVWRLPARTLPSGDPAAPPNPAPPPTTGAGVDAVPQLIPFFAMEFIGGTPITAYAAAHLLGTRQRLDLFVQVCDAVHYAHQRGVIHRDLRPGNILVEEGTAREDRGGQETNPPTPAPPSASRPLVPSPRILDFGLARLTGLGGDLETATAMHTRGGQLMGTVGYMCPEQIDGDPDRVDQRADIYSLGVILHQLLAGRLPFDIVGAPLYRALRTIREDDPTPLGSVARSLVGDLQTIVAVCLEKDPVHRYQSASRLAADIRCFLAYHPIVARGAPWLQRSRTFARRNRPVVGAVAGVLLALSAGLGVAIRQATLATYARARAVQRSKDMRVLLRTLVSDIFDQLQRIQGATQVRERLIQTCRDALESAEVDDAANPSLRHELAQLYMRLAGVQVGSFNSNAGHTDAAVESYSKAISLLEPLLLREPADRSIALDLARARNGRADIHRFSKRPERAIPDRTAALELYHRLLDGPGAGFDWNAASECADTAAVLAELLSETGRDDQARQVGDRLHRLAESLLAHDASAWNEQLMRAGVAFAVARADAALNDLDSALTFFDRALDLYKAAAAATDDPLPTIGVADTHRKIGEVHLRRGDPGAAVESLRTATGIFDGVKAERPERLDTAQIVFVVRLALADALLQAGRTEDAIASAQEALTLAERLRDANPDSTSVAGDLATVNHGAAKVLIAAATSGSLPLTRRLELGHAALALFTTSLDVLDSTPGAEYNSDVTRPMVAAAVSDCTRAIAALERQARPD